MQIPHRLDRHQQNEQIAQRVKSAARIQQDGQIDTAAWIIGLGPDAGAGIAFPDFYYGDGEVEERADDHVELYQHVEAAAALGDEDPAVEE